MQSSQQQQQQQQQPTSQPISPPSEQSANASAAPASSAPSPAPSRSKAQKCALPTCQNRVVKIVGLCRYCAGNFCGTHRLPELHACAQLDSCRAAAHSRLGEKLMREKTVGVKV
ncbi:hypothetical protein M427DRAFT_58597 [Gonapodya prolifera JEL478]|uniref:AN1-type domain-containing protein n=1 Tax=Gonapodya prolifera (strain JEL478) TaxID=1344416 RepID=A0A139AA46_GONPJ|nr:hypothetical protein M427DRAFT_58597 [Gonapodya prolifera JEL478]|eukprot:KXS13559.1 hypothetical protein M427DRAFT_58597 [Gonapodya prolifera JEL478]